MRQTTMSTTTTTSATSSATTEKIDPLMRIQEEIREVKRREEEYRQLKFGEYDEHDADAAINKNNNNNNNNNNNSDNNEHFSMSPEPPVTQIAAVNLLSVPDDSSLASSVNSKESLDEQHSDDSGISASSSPVNGTSANEPKPSHKEKRYIGPNIYNLTPVPPPQKLLTRTVSTPQIFTQNRIIANSPAQKGLMQRFIASRGKIVLNNNNNNNNIANGKLSFGSNSNPYTNNNNNLMSNGNPAATPPNTPATAAINSIIMPDFGARNPAAIIIPTVTMTPPVIERDADGKPIRRGYIPVEVKIQRELKDYKSRESELKKYRKIRDSTPDLLDSIDMENMETDEDDSDVEHCYGPGKLRSAKSIGELCDSAHSNNSISTRTTPSPDFERKLHLSRGGGMRPAMSLAQLCDLDPEEAPSSHRLIAQWESIIKKNEQKSERE